MLHQDLCIFFRYCHMDVLHVEQIGCTHTPSMLYVLDALKIKRRLNILYTIAMTPTMQNLPSWIYDNIHASPSIPRWNGVPWYLVFLFACWFIWKH